MTLLRCLLALSIAPTAAQAERAIVADVTAVVPFDAAELTAALRARLPEGDAIQIRISPTFEGVRIETRGTLRDVPLRGLTGSAAARLVALAASDLLVDDDRAFEPPSLAARRDPTTIGVFGAAALWGQTFGGLGLDVALPRGSWLVAIEGAAGTLVDGPLRMTAAVVRFGAGIRRGMFEVRATGTIAPLVVSNGAGDQTILFGGGASARLRIPLASDLHFVIGGGADVFATRTTYIIEGMSTLTTPRIAPWAAAGLELTP